MKKILFAMMMLVAGIAISAPVRSMLAARSAINAAPSEKWVNPYITDGLIAMWDGEWNAGPGKHDENATVWKDLVGTRDLVVRAGCGFNENSLICSSERTTNDAAGNTMPMTGSQIMTVEICYNATGYYVWRNESLFSAGTFSAYGVKMLKSGYSGLVVWQDKRETDLYMGGTDINITGLRQVQIVFNPESYQSVLVGKVHKNGIEYNMDVKKAETGSGTICMRGIHVFGAANANGSPSSKDDLSMYGYVYAIRLYSRALTEEELAANYAIDKERFNLP